MFFSFLLWRENTDQSRLFPFGTRVFSLILELEYFLSSWECAFRFEREIRCQNIAFPFNMIFFLGFCFNFNEATPGKASKCPLFTQKKKSEIINTFFSRKNTSATRKLRLKEKCSHHEKKFWLWNIYLRKQSTESRIICQRAKLSNVSYWFSKLSWIDYANVPRY